MSVEVLRLSPATSGIEPSQKVWPTTEACWSSSRSSLRSESRRAASTECTVSGSAWASPAPSSRMRLTISSANSGLPPERSATWRIRSAWPFPASASGISAPTSSWARSGPSGSSEIVVALRRPPPQPGRRSSSSSRARQTSSTGPRTQRARYSIRSSIPSSAQWMSSIASTSGFWWLAASTIERTAEKIRSRICWASSESRPTDSATPAGTSIPSGRAISAARRSGGSSLNSSVTIDSRPRRSLRQASSESSESTISNWPRMTSPSAQ